MRVVRPGAARGKSFSAGADLNWMQRMAGYSREPRTTPTRMRWPRCCSALDDLPKPTIALVHGAAIGGGVGLVAGLRHRDRRRGCATSRSREVRLGLMPAVISPYVDRGHRRRARRGAIS